MKKIKRTPVPLPGPSSKKSKPLHGATTSKTPLSQEFISSSDESPIESRKTKKKSKKQTQGKAPIQIAVHRPKPNGLAKVSQVTPPVLQNASKKPLNDELDSGSSSSDDSDGRSTKSQEYPQQESGSEDSDNTSKSSSASSSDSSDKEEEDVQASTQSAAIEKQPPKPHAVVFRPPQPFVPPKGFTAISTALIPPSQSNELLKNLNDKQLWHISAPAGVSLSDLKNIAMDKALNGEAILVHQGTHYGFAPGNIDDTVGHGVLLPRQNGFQPVSTPITQSLHLQQVLRLPNLTSKQADQNTGSEAAASITRSTIRAPRPQVKGLKMHHFHSGFGDQDPGILGSSDSEDDRRPAAGLEIPKGVQALPKPGKRKHVEVNGAERLESPTKKHKKHRTPEELKRREEKKARKEKKKEKERAKSKA